MSSRIRAHLATAAALTRASWQWLIAAGRQWRGGGRCTCAPGSSSRSNLSCMARWRPLPNTILWVNTTPKGACRARSGAGSDGRDHCEQGLPCAGCHSVARGRCGRGSAMCRAVGGGGRPGREELWQGQRDAPPARPEGAAGGPGPRGGGGGAPAEPSESRRSAALRYEPLHARRRTSAPKPSRGRGKPLDGDTAAASTFRLQPRDRGVRHSRACSLYLKARCGTEQLCCLAGPAAAGPEGARHRSDRGSSWRCRHLGRTGAGGRWLSRGCTGAGLANELWERRAGRTSHRQRNLAYPGAEVDKGFLLPTLHLAWASPPPPLTLPASLVTSRSLA